MKRRGFLKQVAAVAAAAGWRRATSETASPTLQGAAANTPLPVVTAVGGIGRRRLGQTNTQLSIIGIGGYHLGLKNVAEADAVRIIRTALDHGINFLDNCWDYNEGVSEHRMGLALQDGYRKTAFLMTKLDGRTGAAAREQLETSLQRLKVDHIDLVQIHEVIRMTDPEIAFRPGNVIDVLQQARKEGKISYIGFTGHKAPAMHLNMIETAARHGFQFDTTQMPVNALDYHFDSFGQRVIPVAQKHGIAVLGMKPLSNGAILKTGSVSAEEALRFAMSLPVTLTVTGCESMENLQQALQVARNFKPLSVGEKVALLEKTRPFADAARFEDYKSSHIYDGTYHNPQWLG